MYHVYIMYIMLCIVIYLRKWGELDWPPPFGRAAYPEEALIRDMDGRTGASLKLTILNDARDMMDILSLLACI